MYFNPTPDQKIPASISHPDGKNLYFHSVAFLPHSDDMQRDATLAAGCSDGNIYMWSISHCILSQPPVAGKLIGHDGSVRSILFTGDGKKLISGSDDRSIRIWDTLTLQQLMQLGGHTSYISSVASTGNKIVSGSYDRSVRIWDVSTGTQLLQMNEHTDPVLSVACAPDEETMPQNKIVASGGYDKSVRLWDMSTGQQVAKLDGHIASVTSVAFSKDSRLIASASRDATVRLWDLSTRRPLNVFEAGWATSTAFSCDGKRIVSGSLDGLVFIWTLWH